MVMNSCLKDLDGRMRLKRMWKLVSQVGKKKTRNEGVEVRNDPRFWEFHQKGLMVDHVRPAATLGGQSIERTEGARPERRWLKTERPLTCLW